MDLYALGLDNDTIFKVLFEKQVYQNYVGACGKCCI